MSFSLFVSESHWILVAIWSVCQSCTSTDEGKVIFINSHIETSHELSLLHFPSPFFSLSFHSYLFFSFLYIFSPFCLSLVNLSHFTYPLFLSFLYLFFFPLMLLILYWDKKLITSYFSQWKHYSLLNSYFFLHGPYSYYSTTILISII